MKFYNYVVIMYKVVSAQNKILLAVTNAQRSKNTAKILLVIQAQGSKHTNTILLVIQAQGSKQNKKLIVIDTRQ